MVRRLSALTRRCGCGHYMFVNCAPAKCFCLPDIGRHRRLCARGNGRGNGGAMRNCCPRARLALRFWRGVVLARGWLCVPVAALFLGSRLLFVLRQTGRLAICSVPILPGRDRLRAFSQCRCGYLPLWVHFGFGCFFMAISTGYRGAEDGDTVPAARPLCVFAQAHWPCYAFRREYVGAARPKPAPKSLRLSGLSSGAGRVRKCISRGGAVLVRIRAAVIRVHGKTRRTPIYGSAGRAV